MNTYHVRYKDSFGDVITKYVKGDSINEVFYSVKQNLHNTAICVTQVYPVLFDYE